MIELHKISFEGITIPFVANVQLLLIWLGSLEAKKVDIHIQLQALHSVTGLLKGAASTQIV